MSVGPLEFSLLSTLANPSSLLPRPYYFHNANDTILEGCIGIVHPLILVETHRCMTL